MLTHEDVPGHNRHGLVIDDWPVLCDDKVRYAGDAVAIVAADTEDIAAAALALIRQVGPDLLRLRNASPGPTRSAATARS